MATRLKKNVPSEGNRRAVLSRRGFIVGATALTLTGVKPQPARSSQNKSSKYRVAVIGHTGRGDYGHGLASVWLDIPEVEIVAVADANRQGLAGMVKRLKATKGYTDYRKMLDEVKPDLVSICPRWVDQHRDMVVAAAERGVRGIYLEKPMCRTLEEADEMIAACEKNKVKVVVAHKTRYGPELPVVRELIRSGKIGEVLEFRGRGKEDHRGGGEDLWVLGTHVLDAIHCLGGKPQWCFGSVQQDGRPIRREDVKPGNEGIGPLAGDNLHAMYKLAGGAVAYFDSVRNTASEPSRFGLCIFGSKGVIEMDIGSPLTAYFLPEPSWSPGRTGKHWIPVSAAGVGRAEPPGQAGPYACDILPVKDLIAAVEQHRQPESNIYKACIATEMIVAVFESQRVGGPVALPLKNRQNPLAMLK